MNVVSIFDYGICNLDNFGNLISIKEKQSYNFLVNAGLYILESKILKLIPENKLYHITNLFEDARKNNFKIGVFPIEEDSWMDVGQWSAYRKTLDKI